MKLPHTGNTPFDVQSADFPRGISEEGCRLVAGGSVGFRAALFVSTQSRSALPDHILASPIRIGATVEASTAARRIAVVELDPLPKSCRKPRSHELTGPVSSTRA
jgi:hypothetical protein